MSRCLSDKCCSKYGWCSTTKDHCNASKSCQSNFDACTEETGKCGIVMVNDHLVNVVVSVVD